MREHLRLSWRQLQEPAPEPEQPPSVSLLVRSSSEVVGRAFVGFVSSLSVLYSKGDAVKIRAALQVAAAQTLALAVTCVARSTLLLVTLSLLVEAGFGVVLVLGYTAWGLIFGVGMMWVFV